MKSWRKKNTNTLTMVDACVSTEDTRTCDAAMVSTDPTVMCVVNTQTEETRMDGVDAYVSTEDPRTCDAATVSTDTTVMCVVYTQTEETRMDGGGAAAKQVYERQHEMNKQKIQKLEEELVVTK
jgi:Flp pilus assembly protein TadD